MKRSFSIAIVTIASISIFCSSSAQTQLELDMDAAQAYKKADDALNVTYKSLLKELDDTGKKKLQAAEKAWIAFRDAECDSQSDDYRGGSIEPMIHSDCAARLTESRTSELKARLDELNRR